ncbi:MAG: hypothetical protein GY793_00185, partial [Proteobacteria bacterium]|nr:hypothetical protein [Pseudomonadota bacterium]
TALVLIIFFNLAACIPYYNFIRNENISVQGNKIAIISGSPDKKTYMLVKEVEHYFQDLSKYEVDNQDSIKKLLGEYPVKIRGPYDLSFVEINSNYGRTDVNKIVKIGKILKVNLVFVLWMPVNSAVNARRDDDNVIRSCFVTQLFNIDTGSEVGKMKTFFFWAIDPNKARSSMLFPRSFNKAISDTARHISKEVAKKMNMLKQNP